MTISLHWFRRDLRLHDNPALAAAVTSSSGSFGVVCAHELTALNPRQRAFVTAAVRSLSATLLKQDASISIVDGDAPSGLAAIAVRLGATRVYCERALDPGESMLERAAEAALNAAGVELVRVGATTIHEPEAVAELKRAAGHGYRVFPPYYDAWKRLPVQRAGETHAPSGLDPLRGALPDADAVSNAPVATEAAGMETLARFVSARAADYGANAEYPGRNATSQLGPYLRFGLVSARSVYRAVREKMVRSWTLAQERDSMEAFVRRLAWRDFYMHLAHFVPAVIDQPLQEKMFGFAPGESSAHADAWEAGMTGYPLVDAAMRQLHAEGRVHQRAAVVAASFATADLGMDWRIGRDVWMRELLVADAALCAGNWQRIAGLGSDQAAYPRIYNPIRQAYQIDAQATYIRRYCKELAKLPTRAALEPWKIAKEVQAELGFFTPEQYPEPIVDHATAARDFLARYQAYRNHAS
ncbi:MAG: deoxyribodipyrimidine photo-lyase [Candidatus Eremiobacteraeota bacterium]|nr:deoxyribodipyrimidine photo-lyase [Candidatus Eremiobacteraeota bacterium]MBV8595894.1 deoxyribodipyrimidine photo-lyase [Candidatus Eremiobacteraeota bacterium]MBV8669487.1 deoxyribodipyrimidine photo-lyase [Candidatus Eremiobacteraeota bacterium]